MWNVTGEIMKRSRQNVLKIVAATAVSVFSLASVVIATVAWFSFASKTQANGETFKVVANGSGYDIGDINLYKFNYSEETIGTGDNAFTVVNYLTPYTGNVGKYLFDSTRHQFGEEVNSVWEPVTVMNIFDPIDLIVQRHELIDLNCNAIYEVTVTSSAFTDCYLSLDAIHLEDKTKNNNEIFLSDCVDFDVFTEADLADGTNGYFPNGDEYYPSYYSRIPHALTAEETTYYKIAYLSSLTSQDVSTNTHAHFYGNNPKPESVNITHNRQISFHGESEVKSLKLYINVNYAVSELNKYASSIYQRNIHAVFDYAFEIKVSQGALS